MPKKFVANPEIAKNIELNVKSSQKSQKEIAAEVGITPTTLSQYIYGKAFPSIATLIKLCKSLDCNYEDILGKL